MHINLNFCQVASDKYCNCVFYQVDTVKHLVVKRLGGFATTMN